MKMFLNYALERAKALFSLHRRQAPVIPISLDPAPAPVRKARGVIRRPHKYHRSIDRPVWY